MLTGYECYLRKNPEGKYDRYETETHLNLFARDPKNETIICYNKSYCKYLNDEEKTALKKAGSERIREYTHAYINEFIQTARENGYLVAYNHPYWSMEMEADTLSYEGLFSMEMCNYNSYLKNRLDYNAALYDKMLRVGKKIFCHSADDNQNKFPEGDPFCDSFGGFTMIICFHFFFTSLNLHLSSSYV